jgi:hypothetical protein
MEMPARPLEGVIDAHAHCGPDSMTRTIDGVDLARLSQGEGMRAIVLKNHFESTAALAYLARKAVPGMTVFGGIALNLAVGGINPQAVEHMSMMTGGCGRVVWMPTFDADSHIRHFGEDRPFVSVSRDGRLLPQVQRVIEIIARRDLVLATGHSSAEECLLLVDEGRRQGVRRMVVTHAAMAPIHMSPAQMKEAADAGAWIEFVYNGLIGPYKEFELCHYAGMIREIGVQCAILASDLGQPVNPVHPEGLKSYFEGMRAQGFSDAEMSIMTRDNPAALLL